ncbi:MAG: hypothetical protein NTZ05_05705 [Chloroflexi bacterium]|nr:hypothetical protein [Chloroflexota bacterium]
MTLDLRRFIAALAAVGLFLAPALWLEAPWFWVALLFMVIAGGAGAAALLRPPLSQWSPAAILTHLALPNLMLFAAALSLRSFSVESPLLVTVAGGLALLIFGVLLAGKHYLMSSEEGHAGHAGPIGELLNIATYFTAFLLFVSLYRLAPPLTAKIGVIAVIGALLTLELLSHIAATATRRLILSGVVGLTLAETALSLHTWPQEGAFTAMFLLLGFYLITGILQSHFRHRLTTGVVLEFVGVGVVSFVFLFVFQAWRLG